MFKLAVQSLIKMFLLGFSFKSVKLSFWDTLYLILLAALIFPSVFFLLINQCQNYFPLEAMRQTRLKII